MAIQVWREVEVVVGLDDFDTRDLELELEARGINAWQPEEIVEKLRDAGCPEDILFQLDRWLQQKIVTSQMLESWKMACGI